MNVSIGKRFIDFARSELNSLLERAADLDDEREERDPLHVDHDGASSHRRPGPGVRLEDLSDEELEAEIERRHLEKELRDGTRPRPSTPPRRPAADARRSAPPPPRPPSHADEVARAYAVLELRPGADFEAVRKSYRTLMRKYHPDRHAHSPEKQRAATELAQKLSEAYALLEKRLRK
jgi:DnaJ-domain-containing protein 1